MRQRGTIVPPPSTPRDAARPRPALRYPTAAERSYHRHQRLLDMVPGVLGWSLIIGFLVGAVLAPQVVLISTSVIAVYLAVRFIWFSGATVRLRRWLRQWEAADYPNHPDVQHVVLIPNYKEPAHVMARSLAALAQYKDARRQMTIILATEGTEKGGAAKAEQLAREFEGQFAAVLVTIHPAGLPGEIACKSANIAYAARWVREVLLPQRAWHLDDVLITTMDADTLWHPRYFEALTHQFAKHPLRHRRFFQGIMRYHGNVWDVRAPFRLLHTYAGAFEFAFMGALRWPAMPMSSYSLSLRLLENCGYWDGDAIADEWHMFIKAYFRTHGGVKTERIFLPFYAEATDGTRERYLQSLRHAWGSKEIGYVLGYPLRYLRDWLLVLRVSHEALLAGPVLTAFAIGGSLPLLANPALLWHPAYWIIQGCVLITTTLGLFVWWLDVISRPARPTPMTWRGRLNTLLSFALLPTLMGLVLTLPTLDAQTRLMLGIPLRFRVTPKGVPHA